MSNSATDDNPHILSSEPDKAGATESEAVANASPLARFFFLKTTFGILLTTLLSFAFGWAENMVQAAIKAVPLGQSAGQRILQALINEIPPAIDHAMTLPDTQRQAFTPMLAILSSQHETQYSRLFRS